MLHTLIAGYLFSLSLIVAIGSQNAFVLRQGIIGRHVLIVCLICALSDALLIQVGVFALDAINQWLPNFAKFMRYGGAAFLLFYALSRFHAAYHGNNQLSHTTDTHKHSRQRTILTVLALTFLNPHVYIDTVLLLGTVASHYRPLHTYFALGATLASFSFFFALGYGARLLQPLFRNRKAWQILDIAIGLFMLFLSIQLIRHA